MKNDIGRFSYPGNELEIFAEAKNWKAYWASKICEYIGPKVLEVGAGLGSNTRLVASSGHDYWLGLEPDSVMHSILVAEQKRLAFPDCVEFRCQTVADLELDYAFDTILYIDVLEHIQDDKREIEMATHLLTGGGYLVLLAPAYQFLYSPFDKAIGHYRRYDRQMLKDLTPSGLTNVCTYFLDSIGIIASLANVLVLSSPNPSVQQIRFWDRCMMPLATIVDRIAAYSFGRSVIQVWQKRQGDGIDYGAS